MPKEKCIILNKPFIGGYLSADGHDAHEIINFFKADDGVQYIYDNPYGQNVSNAANLDITHLVLTSGTSNHSFFINYVIKIKKTLHTRTIAKSQINSPSSSADFSENAKKEIESALNKEIGEIKYGGTPIDKLFSDDLPVAPITFIAEEMWKAKKPVRVLEDDVDYHFARNFGYVSETTKSPKTYAEILKKINDKSNWDSFPVSAFKEKTDQYELSSMDDNLFLDLIGLHKEEECYTKMVASLLSEKNMFASFISFIVEKDNISCGFEPLAEKWQSVRTETSFEGAGRIDIIAESPKARVIIENKIDSGINFIVDKKGNRIDQLNRYFAYFDKCKATDDRDTLYIVLTPKYRKEEVALEIQCLPNEMSKRWNVIDYSDLFGFMHGQEKELVGFKYKKYISDILLLFKRMSFDRRELAGLKLTKNKTGI